MVGMFAHLIVCHVKGSRKYLKLSPVVLLDVRSHGIQTVTGSILRSGNILWNSQVYVLHHLAVSSEQQRHWPDCASAPLLFAYGRNSFPVTWLMILAKIDRCILPTQKTRISLHIHTVISLQWIFCGGQGLTLIGLYKWAATWQNQQNDCAPSEDSEQPRHLLSLVRVFAVRSLGS